MKAGAAWPGATHPRGVLRPRIPARDRPFASVPRCCGARLCDCGRGAELTEPDKSVLSAEVHTTHRESAYTHNRAQSEALSDLRLVGEQTQRVAGLFGVRLVETPGERAPREGKA